MKGRAAMTNGGLDGAAACVFDAYGTLFDVGAAAGRCAGELGDKAAPLAALWRQKQLSYSWLRSLMGRHADFWQVTGDALDYAMAGLGITGDGLRDRLMALYRELGAYDDAKPLLAALRLARRPTAILSNGSPDMLASAVAAAGLGEFVDHVISIEDVGIYKPHHRAYGLVTERLALPAAQVCFVSANGWDAAGGADFGFQSIWINRDGAPRERLPGVPSAEIRSLGQLSPLLGLEDPGPA
jgi:2-haloacid dehalogenase